MSTAVRKSRKNKIARVVMDQVKPVSAKGSHPAGIWSLVGLLALLAYITYRVGGFALFFNDFPLLLTGRALDLVGQKSEVFPTSVTVIFLDVIVSFAMLFFMGVTGNLKNNGKHAVGDMMRNMKVSHHFFSFIIAVAIEEMLARGIFLGLFRKIPGLDGPVAFYVLFLMGNGIWSWIHLKNFEDEEDRHIIKVLPQFVSGILFTYVFLKYGLFMSIVVHMGCNAVLFSLHKVQDITPAFVLGTMYSILVAAIAYVLMSHPLGDMAAWVKNPADEVPGYPQAIAGWNFWDYLLAGLVVNYGLASVFGVLAFDSGVSDTEKEKKEVSEFYTMLMGMTFFLALVTALMLGFVYGLYWFIGLFTSNFLIRGLGASVLLACIQRGNSGSSVSRVFWCTLPCTYLSICIYEVLGFWLAAGYVLINLLIACPMLALKDMHSKEVA